MSMNKFMHPRNIYKLPPDFKQLAADYPEFRNYAKLDLSGKVSLDFKDVHALRALSCALLKKDFELDVDIPTNKLIPTIPLRFNYILWIEDLLSITDCSDVITGIDIGTGASCVYPLICAKKYNWHMVATENDNESFASARANVAKNTLNNLITVVNVRGDTMLNEILESSTSAFDFCMCNPPFFGSTQELSATHRSRKLDRPKPKNAFCATTSEVVAKGGEVEFVSKIIQESKQLQDRIKIYTSMVGQKSSLPALKKLLREADVVSFKQTEFCQGNTTRWGLAWTFCNIDLRKIPQPTLIASRKTKAKPPLHHLLETADNCTMEDVTRALNEIFNQLHVNCKLNKSKKHVTFVLKAYENTWSHQRRKRREEKRLKSTTNPEVSEEEAKQENGEQVQNNNENEIIDTLSSMKMNSPPNKRLHEDDDSIEEFYNVKKFKSDDINARPVYLEFMAKVYEENKEFLLELLLLNECRDKDSLNQILQYIKNNLNI